MSNLVTYHPAIRCQMERGGFHPEHVAVKIKDRNRDRNQYLITFESMTIRRNDGDYLAVGFVEIDHLNCRVLVELPNEADSGINRMWVPF